MFHGFFKPSNLRTFPDPEKYYHDFSSFANPMNKPATAWAPSTARKYVLKQPWIHIHHTYKSSLLSSPFTVNNCKHSGNFQDNVILHEGQVNQNGIKLWSLIITVCTPSLWTSEYKPLFHILCLLVCFLRRGEGEEGGGSLPPSNYSNATLNNHVSQQTQMFQHHITLYLDQLNTRQDNDCRSFGFSVRMRPWTE